MQNNHLLIHRKSTKCKQDFCICCNLSSCHTHD